MPLSIHELTVIAQRAAAKTSPSLAVSGVTLGGGEGSEYVEILIIGRSFQRADKVLAHAPTAPECLD